MNETQNVSEDGDKVHITAQPTATVSAVTDATGAFTSSTWTPTAVELDINEWQYSAVEVTDRARKQSQRNWQDDVPSALAKALAEDIENKILALESSVTNTAGDGSGDIGQDEILAAIQTLGQAKLNPMRNPGRFTFVFDWEQYAPLKKERILSDAAFRGTNAGGTQTTELSNIYGIPTFLTNQVADGTDGPASAATKSNLLFAPEAFAWAIQSDIEFRMDKPSDRLSTVMVAHYLAGFKANLVARAVKLPSAS